MPPKQADDIENVDAMFVKKRAIDNNELIENAGKVILEEGKPWGKGICHDMRTTVGTHWVEEMVNFNQKTVAVTLLVFITVIAPTLTFGAVYGKATENNIGAIETILATAWVGVVYSLIGGMPTVSRLDLSFDLGSRSHRLTFVSLLPSSASSVRLVLCWPSRRLSTTSPRPSTSPT